MGGKHGVFPYETGSKVITVNPFTIFFLTSFSIPRLEGGICLGVLVGALSE
jgi:hypothetical protein